MQTFKVLLGYVPEKKLLPYISIIFSALGAVISALSLFYIYEFLMMFMGATNNLQQSFEIAKLCMITLIVGGLLYFTGGIISHKYAFRLETNLKKKGIEGISQASYAFFEKHESGSIRKVIDDNSALTHSLIAHLIPDMTFAVVYLLSLLVIGFLINLTVGIVVIALFALSIALTYKMMGNGEFMKLYLSKLEEMNGEAIGYVRGMQIIKTFNAQVSSLTNFYSLIEDYSDIALKYTLSCRKWWVAYRSLFLIVPLLAVIWGSYSVYAGENLVSILTTVIMITLFSGLLFTALMKIMYTGSHVTTANNCINKLENLYNEMFEEKITHGNETNFDSFDIEFKNVNFGYSETLVLENFNLSLPENKTYALIGPSGSGKSTIAKLVSGFYKLQSGSILIGGKPIESYNEKALNKHIAFVFQNSKLFQTSIYENVLMGKPSATHEEVMHALELAECMPIINALPEKEHSIIGSKGVYLSGGEIQRISIARAILKDADIIILDEASAATDPQCEYEILKAFKNLIENKTVLIIAHRLNTIRGVDEILVINDGEVIERGNNEELMSLDGFYSNFQHLYTQANDWEVTHD